MGFSLAPLANIFKMSDTDSDNDTQDDASASSDVLIKSNLTFIIHKNNNKIEN